MTIYRRRLASSFHALCVALRRHLDAIAADGRGRLTGSDEDAPDDETADEMPDADEAAELERQALAEEADHIGRLLAGIGRLPPDGKLDGLKGVLKELNEAGFARVMVFTQFTDTMDFLREVLRGEAGARLMCFSGRSREIPAADGGWRVVGRDEARRRFRDGEAEILLCTDAAAEGLNLQFCGAWSTTTCRGTRCGSNSASDVSTTSARRIRSSASSTCTTRARSRPTCTVHRALRSRIGLFETVIGRLQPILAQPLQTIADAVLSGGGREGSEGAGVVEVIGRQAQEAEAGGFDLDAVLDDDITLPGRPPSSVTMDDLDRVIASPGLMPPGTDVLPMEPRAYSLLASGMGKPVRVAADPAFYGEHAESVELRSPGNPLFNPPEDIPEPAPWPEGTPLGKLLGR